MSTLTPAPTLDMAPEEFDPAAEAFVESMVAFEVDMNAKATTVAANTATALAAQAAAAASAHFVGAWSSLAGALAIPASVSHGGRVWVLVANVADVTAHVPGVSANWVPSFPQRRLAIFDTATLTLLPFGGNEVAHNTVESPGLVATHVCSDGSSFVANAVSGSQVAQSADGRTWTLRSLPASGSWAVLPVAGGYVAVRQASSGATASAYSADSGVTWTGLDVAGTTWQASGGQIQTLCAGGAGHAIASSNFGTVFVATAPGVWSAVQTPPASVTGFFVAGNGNFVARTASATYHTSATGLTGSWTARTLPGSSDTVVQGADGELLAYVAGSIVAPVYSSTDGVTWTNLGIRLVHAAVSIRAINGIYLCGPASGATTGWTRHGSLWVPRTLMFAPDANPRQLAKAGTKHVGITGGLAYLFDHAAVDAALSIWE